MKLVQFVDVVVDSFYIALFSALEQTRLTNETKNIIGISPVNTCDLSVMLNAY